jgi:hypothetical protein
MELNISRYFTKKIKNAIPLGTVCRDLKEISELGAINGNNGNT